MHNQTKANDQESLQRQRFRLALCVETPPLLIGVLLDWHFTPKRGLHTNRLTCQGGADDRCLARAMGSEESSDDHGDTAIRWARWCLAASSVADVHSLFLFHGSDFRWNLKRGSPSTASAQSPALTGNLRSGDMTCPSPAEAG